MSARNWQLRAEDIFESIQNIRTYTEGMDYPTWCEDKKTIDAMVRNFEIIGEAANHIPADFQSRYPHIPWQQIRGIRNVLIHEYFGVDEEVIWKAIQDDIPALEKMFAQLLEKHG
ncbi:MAG: DUF86 domain-containing protein [Desulfuromusa sp.]